MYFQNVFVVDFVIMIPLLLHIQRANVEKEIRSFVGIREISFHICAASEYVTVMDFLARGIKRNERQC